MNIVYLSLVTTLVIVVGCLVVLALAAIAGINTYFEYLEKANNKHKRK